MNSDDPGVNVPMAALPAELSRVAGSRYAALQESLGEALPALAALPGDAARVLACSDYVAHSCARHPEVLRGLLDSGDLQGAYGDDACYPRRTAAAIEATTDDAGLMLALRTLKRREMVRIAWRDIGGLADFEQTLGETSAFADAVLQASVARLHHWLSRDTGEPRAGDGSPL